MPVANPSMSSSSYAIGLATFRIKLKRVGAISDRCARSPLSQQKLCSLGQHERCSTSTCHNCLGVLLHGQVQVPIIQRICSFFFCLVHGLHLHLSRILEHRLRKWQERRSVLRVELCILHLHWGSVGSSATRCCFCRRGSIPTQSSVCLLFNERRRASNAMVYYHLDNLQGLYWIHRAQQGHGFLIYVETTRLGFQLFRRVHARYAVCHYLSLKLFSLLFLPLVFLLFVILVSVSFFLLLPFLLLVVLLISLFRFSFVILLLVLPLLVLFLIIFLFCILSL
mmetsp:Transcript_49994/g.116819  ORF Transcript_49994/g.116819 Transcript_49994/m.116819 type:complete len:281 (-) Transcript_49994:793-1635(-)